MVPMTRLSVDSNIMTLSPPFLEHFEARIYHKTIIGYLTVPMIKLNDA